MNYVETILPEFDREMANTRKVLERVPEHKLDWQAHPQSHTIGWNANHLAPPHQDSRLGRRELHGAIVGLCPDRRRSLSVPEVEESSGNPRPV